MNWDEYHLLQATTVATKSKDPSTKVGAVIVRPDNSVAATGFNGFPRGIADTPERLNDRPTKYSLVIHAEMNAVLTAREPLHGYTVYTTLMPCDRCFVHLIQAGIKRVVSPKPTEDQLERWKDSFDKVFELAAEANVELTIYG